MKRFGFIKEDGFVAMVSNPGVDDNYVEGNEFYGYICHEIPDDADPVDVVHNWYWKDGWKQRLPQPSQFHEWNAGIEQWVANVEEAKFDKKQQVNYLRQQKDNKPIGYLGAMFDGTYESKTNLQSVCNSLSLGNTLPDGFEWRDSSNVMHVANVEFISGLLAAFVARTNEIYNVSWQHKQNIEQLDSFEQVVQYDINQGW